MTQTPHPITIPNSKEWANEFWRMVVRIHQASPACRERAAKRESEAKGATK